MDLCNLKSVLWLDKILKLNWQSLLLNRQKIPGVVDVD